jgi:DNA-binding response OmpR family regulator
MARRKSDPNPTPTNSTPPGPTSSGPTPARPSRAGPGDTAPTGVPLAEQAIAAARAVEFVAPARVLIVSPSRAERQKLAAQLIATGKPESETAGVGSCEQADTLAAAMEFIEQDHFDLVLVRSELPDGTGLELARRLSGKSGMPAPIIVSDAPTLEDAVAAMRCGAVDIISSKSAGRELVSAVRTATAKARRQFDKDARIARLTKVCKQLNQVRHEITSQVSTMCGDLVDAYQELSGQVVQMSVASEFNSLIRQELDVESLLRTALEFVLAKTGPTNAAVYLPSNSSDYSLGAYVNYDLNKDTADLLFETMACVLPPRMERCKELRAFNRDPDLTAFLGEHAHWMEHQCLVTFSCHHEGECLAVVALFRDRRQPFGEALLPVFRTIAELFGRQLARVIHVHHRHLPKDQWGGFGPGDEDDQSDDRMAA